jgi:hypothetical protein
MLDEEMYEVDMGILKSGLEYSVAFRNNHILLKVMLCV